MLRNKNIFLDANVVIDFLDRSRKRHLVAVSLFEKLIIDNYIVFTSEDILTTIFYILKDKKQTLLFFKTIAEKWNIVSFGKKAIEKAIDICLENNLDFEDVLQCLCAKGNGCDIFITNDKDFYNCGLNIVTAEEFLKQE